MFYYIVSLNLYNNLTVGNDIKMNKPQIVYTNSYMKDINQRCKNRIKLDPDVIITIRKLRLADMWDVLAEVKEVERHKGKKYWKRL